MKSLRLAGLLLPLLGAAPVVAQSRVLEVQYVPTKRAQVAVWIERADGTYLRTLLLTESVGLRGIGNRPGAMMMNSGFRWPYGRREGVLPVWAHSRGSQPGDPLFPMLIFQDRLSEGRASQTSADQSPDSYFCLSFQRSAAYDVDATTCASQFNSDKGRFMTAADLQAGYSEPIQDESGTPMRRPLPMRSYYPPRRDYPGGGPLDSPDLLQLNDLARAIMPEIDAVTRATAPADTPQVVTYSIPADWNDGDYVVMIEVNTERDHNETWSEARFPTPGNPSAFEMYWDSWAMDYGYPYRGQPSVVYRLPFTVSASGVTVETTGPIGYGDLHGETGTVHPIDITISNDPVTSPGSGADRLRVGTNGRRALLTLDMCTEVATVPAVPTIVAAPVSHEKHSHEWASVAFPAIAIGERNAAGYQVKVSKYPIDSELAFEQAEDAKANTLDFQGLDLCPVDPVTSAPVCPAAGTMVAFDIGKLDFSTVYHVAVRATGRCGDHGPITTTTFETTAIHFETVTPCFVATAAHGSAMAPDVNALRAFRDASLMPYLPGRALVATYYRVGPAFARVISGSEVLRAVARALLEPFVAAVGGADEAPRASSVDADDVDDD